MVKYFHLAVATALLAAAPAAADEKLKAEVIHAWTSPGESAALKVFADAFNAAGGEWVDQAVAGWSNMIAAEMNRLAGGNPPAAMQFNIGPQIDNLISQGLIRDIDAVAVPEGWATLLPPAFVAGASRDGKFYAVPVNVHGQNWMFYSTAAFEKAGLGEPAADWDGLFAQMDALKAAGIIPIAFAGQPWLEQLAFDDVLLSKGGKDLFLRVYRDKDIEALQSPEFRAVVETFGRLRDYIDEGAPNRNFNDASAMLISGKAAIQFAGDWVKGEFRAAGWTAGKEFGCVIGPGDAPFAMGGDVFVFPAADDPEMVKAQNLLATVLISPEAQVRFNDSKGSVPVRSDVDVSGLDACAQKGLEMLKDGDRQVPTTYLLISGELNGALQDVITAYWNDSSATPDDLVAGFVDAFQSTE